NGNRYFLSRPGQAAPAGDVREEAGLETDLAPVLRHVTLRWSASSDVALRHVVEADLARALAEVRTRSNPVGGWLLTGSALLLLLTTFFFATALLYRTLLR